LPSDFTCSSSAAVACFYNEQLDCEYMQKDHTIPPPAIAYSRPGWLAAIFKVLLWAGGLATAGLLCILFMVGLALATAYPNLPDVSELTDYRPKLPLRVFSAEGALLGEFGEEHRNLTLLKDIPKHMQNAVLAIEDARFFSHGGVDYLGVLRAGLANLGRSRSQGASTITMQVARNVYLSNEKTYTRKIYEILLTFKLESSLSKEQILEIYMNQIFLGNRAHGFSAAAETYFGKPLKTISIAEAAMLAGVPKFPSTANPIANYTRAKRRQMYIIERMQENGFISETEAAVAKAEDVKIRNGPDASRVHAEFVTETVRQLIFAQYGEETYTRGLDVVTTIKSAEQQAAYRALRKGIMDFERRQAYRGPEKFIDLPSGKDEMEEAVDDALGEQPDNDEVLAAVVLEAGPKKIIAMRRSAEQIEITADGLKPAQSGLSASAAGNIRIRRGAIIRVVKTNKGAWEITQLPEVEGAFIALDPRTGALRALVGGFDYDKNKFNHVTQAWRQPGSSFKPFIYSAALEKGFSGATVINDAPLFFDAGVTGSQAWEPKNYDGTFDGPMSMRRGLAKSKNMISIRILQSIGVKNAQEWLTNFGFDAEKHPPYLTMALGAGSVTPMQMATGYAVFANGGFRVNPFVISKISDQKGRVLLDHKPPVLDETMRGIDARNAFIMTNLMQEITRSGTAAKAQATLKRPDIYGKTGTTNDSIDAWFAGYHPSVVAVSWIGYDSPRKLGDKETGGGLSLPVWISYMQTALRGIPVSEPSAPEGVVNIGGEWFYDEFVKGAGVSSLGLTDPILDPNIPLPTQNPTETPAEENKSILDLFRN
jgi:penicillin-binding protein 1A